jgi:tetratricopeptide (TPR) repeat protein
MKKVENPFVTGQEILFSSKIDPTPPKPVSYNWTASPEGCTFLSNGGNSTSITCSSAGSYTVNVTAKMDGMEIGSATTSVSVTAQPGGVTGADKAKEAAREKKAVEEKKAAEAKKALEVKQAAEEKKTEEAKKAAEAKRAAEEKKHKEEKAQGLINEGYAKEKQGNIKEALDKYKAAREIVPDAGLADRIRGLEQKERQAQQTVNEGYSLEKQGRLAEAVEKYKSAVKISPDPKLTEHVALVEKKIADEKKRSAAEREKAELKKEKAKQAEAGRSAAPGTRLEKGKPIYSNYNSDGVNPGPTNPTKFTIDQPYRITLIEDYHWANTRDPGTIGLKAQSGEVFGPWQAIGNPDVPPQLSKWYWQCYPDTIIPAGTYTVIDSDPGTWSQNYSSNGCGMTRIEGNPESEPRSRPRSPQVPSGEEEASSSGEIGGRWVFLQQSQDEIEFSRTGDLYSGRLVTWKNAEESHYGHKRGEEVYSMKRLSEHVYSGIITLGREWEKRDKLEPEKIIFKVWGDKLYLWDKSEKKPPPGTPFFAKKSR